MKWQISDIIIGYIKHQYQLENENERSYFISILSENKNVDRYIDRP